MPEMPTVFIRSSQIDGDSLTVGGDDFRYLRRVLRLRAGDELVALDDEGREHVCQITAVGRRELAAVILQTRPPAPERAPRITLHQGLPKGDKMDLIVEKATELGVAAIVPLVTERSQVRTTRKVERWKRVAAAAARQCGRRKPPHIVEPRSYAMVMDSRTGGRPPLGILFYEGGGVPLGEIKPRGEGVERIDLYVGPEGGFSPAEVETARSRGVQVCTLGPRVLRCETASIVAVTLIQYRWGDLQPA